MSKELGTLVDEADVHLTDREAFVLLQAVHVCALAFLIPEGDRIHTVNAVRKLARAFLGEERALDLEAQGAVRQ